MAVTVMSLGGVVSGYIFATRQAEWSGYSLAAQALAAQRLEQTRAAKWDLRSTPPADELTTGKFPTVSVNVLDIPVSGTNIAYATNLTTFTDVSTGGYQFRLIRVDCLWSFNNRPYSNTVATYRAPDQ